MVAGRAIGLWDMERKPIDLQCKQFQPSITAAERNMRREKWNLAVSKSFGWHI